MSVVEEPTKHDDNNNNNENNNSVGVSSTAANPIMLHQTIFQNDPDWYQQYVIDILGKEFCTQVWPITNTTLTSNMPLTSVSVSAPTLAPTDQSTDFADASPIVVKPSTLISKSVETEGKWPDVDQSQPSGNVIEKETLSNPRIAVDTDGPIQQDDVDDPDRKYHATYSKEERLSHPATTTETTVRDGIHGLESNLKNNTIQSDDSKQGIESPSQTTTLRLETPLAAPLKSSTKEEEVSLESSTRIGTPMIDNNLDRKTAFPTTTDDHTIDQRVVVYREIIGNALTMVPLQNLTKMGYSVEELQRMQSDALCVVVNDQIRNLRMGIPFQWCLPNKSVPAQVLVVDSMEDALGIVKADRATKRQGNHDVTLGGREAKVQVSTATNDPSDKVTKSNDHNEVTRNGKQQSGVDGDTGEDQSPRPYTKTRTIPSSREQVEVMSSADRSWRNAVRDDVSTETMRRNRNNYMLDNPRGNRNRQARGNDEGRIKRIYTARVPYSNGIQPTKIDRGDPPVPKGPWMDFETFKNLLRKEAELRMRIVGERFAPNIKQESQWRLELYKAWLWQLHDGIGESFIPPSRYERARRMRRSGGIYKAKDNMRVSTRPGGPPKPKAAQSRNKGR
jgi:hypothetical protein